LANKMLRAECVILGIRPSSSCLGSHPFQEEFLSAPIHSPLSGRLIGPSQRGFGVGLPHQMNRHIVI
jgi:hypothetical protein